MDNYEQYVFQKGLSTVTIFGIEISLKALKFVTDYFREIGGIDRSGDSGGATTEKILTPILLQVIYK